MFGNNRKLWEGAPSCDSVSKLATQSSGGPRGESAGELVPEDAGEDSDEDSCTVRRPHFLSTLVCSIRLTVALDGMLTNAGMSSVSILMGTAGTSPGGNEERRSVILPFPPPKLQ